MQSVVIMIIIKVIIIIIIIIMIIIMVGLVWWTADVTVFKFGRFESPTISQV